MRAFRRDNARKMQDFAVLEAANLSRHDISSILQVGPSTLGRWEYFRAFITDMDSMGGTFSTIRCMFEIYAACIAQGKTDTQKIIDILGDEKQRKNWKDRFAKWKSSKNLETRLEEYEDSKPDALEAEERLWIQRLLEVSALDGDRFSKERASFELYAIQLSQGKDDLKEIIKLLEYDLGANKQKREKWKEKFADWQHLNLKSRLEMYNDWGIQQRAEAEQRWLQRILHPIKTPAVNEDIITEIQVRYALRHILQGLHTVKDIEAFCVSIETDKDFPENIRSVINTAASLCKIRTFKLTRILRNRVKILTNS